MGKKIHEVTFPEKKIVPKVCTRVQATTSALGLLRVHDVIIMRTEIRQRKKKKRQSYNKKLFWGLDIGCVKAKLTKSQISQVIHSSAYPL